MDPWAQFLASLRIDQLSSNVILGLVVLMIFTGKLQWHSVGDAWKDLYFREQKRTDMLMQQNSELIDAGRVSVRVLDALPTSLTGGEPDGLEATTATRRKRRQAGSAVGDS